MVKRTEVGNHLIDPKRIRSLATGIGQTQQRSERTGSYRAERVVSCMPPGVIGKTIGYTKPDPMIGSIMSYPGQDSPLPADGSVNKR